MGRDPHWGASGSSHILRAPVLRFNIRKISLLGWLEQLTGGLWEVWTQLREACACLFTPETGQREATRTVLVTGQAPGHSGTHPSLRKTTRLVSLP